PSDTAGWIRTRRSGDHGNLRMAIWPTPSDAAVYSRCPRYRGRRHAWRRARRSSPPVILGSRTRRGRTGVQDRDGDRDVWSNLSIFFHVGDHRPTLICMPTRRSLLAATGLAALASTTAGLVPAPADAA